jgi:hypothetical protein
MQTLQSARIPVECRALNTPQQSINELQADIKERKKLLTLRKNVMYWHIKMQMHLINMSCFLTNLYKKSASLASATVLAELASIVFFLFR